MIDTVGYTEDGNVWLTFSASFEGKNVKATMTLDPQNALNASKSLVEAAEKALTCQKQPTPLSKHL